MTIPPSSTIRFLRGVPLDPTYQHTIWFGSIAAQAQYFIGLTKHVITNSAYQRVNTGLIRVGIAADQLYDCNYVMFQNTSFGNKWFYAFITSVEYVNNSATEVTFELDVMQTWYFDYSLGQCFIEREHSATDAVGENTVPENLELGPYISNSRWATGLSEYQDIVIAATFDPSMNDYGGEFTGGQFTGLYYHVFPNSISGAQAAANLILQATEAGKSDGIVSMFIMREAFVTQNGDSYRDYTFQIPSWTSGTLDGYLPRNKKLYTWPYNVLYCTNNQGGAAEFRYELFNGLQPAFYVMGTMTPNPEIVMYPTGYENITGNLDNKMTIGGFPQLSYNIDSYKAWLAQNGGSLAVSAISTVVGGVSSLLVPGAGMGGAVNAFSSIAGMLAQNYQQQIQPPQSRGGGGAGAMAVSRNMDFDFYAKSITAEYARIIDDYFTMFGYATHKIKVPNTNVRPAYTFTKTKSCVVRGSVPGGDIAKICSIYDNGITFWRNGNQVGNYSLNNQV